MAIVPKRKHSQARRDKRRSNVWKLEAPTLRSARSVVNEVWLLQRPGKSLAWGGLCVIFKRKGQR